MSVVINQNAAKDAQEEAAKRLQRTAVFFITQLMRRLSVSNPRPYLNPSRPGEYPRKRTGNAIANVQLDATSVGDIITNGLKVRAGVGQNAMYLAILEFFKDRKGFRDALEELRPQLEAMLTAKAP